MTKKIIYAVVVLALMGGSFFGGITYQKNKKPSFANSIGAGTTMNGYSRNGQVHGAQNSNGGFNRPNNGEITAIDGNTITIKDQDGSSKNILINDSTSIAEMATTTKDKLTVGTKIMASGTENQDKSITAKNIQIEPANK